MNLLSVVGARPQFVKLAPVNDAFDRAGFGHTIVHTGQHYDDAMSDQLFRDLAIPSADYNLKVGSGLHGEQTAAMLSKLEEVFLDVHPDAVVVFGDTNSTLAAAIAAAKIHLPIVHVEAGLRSFNRAMPEEHNRVLTDHCSDLLLAPTETAMSHLSREGLGHRAINVGDVMLDVFERVVGSLEMAGVQRGSELADGSSYALATIHRAENTDDARRLQQIIDELSELPIRVVLPVHPRLKTRAELSGIDLHTGAIQPIEPLGYLDLVSTLVHSGSVITDSGGLQKEAFFAGKMCTTLRTETEWDETLIDGWNVLSDPEQLRSNWNRPKPERVRSSPFGDGHASELIASEVEKFLT